MERSTQLQVLSAALDAAESVVVVVHTGSGCLAQPPCVFSKMMRPKLLHFQVRECTNLACLPSPIHHHSWCESVAREPKDSDGRKDISAH